MYFQSIPYLPDLREYQKHSLALWNKDISADKRVNGVIQLPTGTGKGLMILHQLLYNLEAGKKTLVIVPSEFLCHNLGDRIKHLAPKQYKHYHAIYTGQKKNFSKPITVVVYKTANNAIKSGDLTSRMFDMVIHDEVHHCMSDTWSNIFSLTVPHVGYTATPTRLDGKPLDTHFNRLYTSPGLDWFINQGYLSPYTLYTTSDISLDALLNKRRGDDLSTQNKTLNTGEQIGKDLELWEQYAFGKKTFVYCVSDDHARSVAEQFNAKYEGKYNKYGVPIKFGLMLSSQSRQENNAALNDFNNNKSLGIINITMLTEGIDVQDAICCFMLRYTWSTSLYLQMVGRVLRYEEMKKAIILDPVGNAMYHGSPSYEHDWQLQGKLNTDVNYKFTCSYCDLPLISKSKVARLPDRKITIECPNCGIVNDFELSFGTNRPKRKFNEVTEGELVEFTATPETMRLYNILMNNYSSTNRKMNDILRAKADNVDKAKCLKYLGFNDMLINMYLGNSGE